MKILAIEQEASDATPEAFQPHLTAEAARVWELYQAGVVREFYFRADQHRAILVLEGADVGVAQAALRTLPLVRAGLITFEVIPLAPYPGLARLFSDGV